MIKPDTSDSTFLRLATEFETATGLKAPGQDMNDVSLELLMDKYNKRVKAWRKWLSVRTNSQRQFSSRTSFESVNDIYERAKTAVLDELKNDGRQRG